MKPFSEEEHGLRLLLWGTVFMMSRYKDGKVEHFLLDKEEITFKELHHDTAKKL